MCRLIDMYKAGGGFPLGSNPRQGLPVSESVGNMRGRPQVQQTPRGGRAAQHMPLTESVRTDRVGQSVLQTRDRAPVQVDGYGNAHDLAGSESAYNPRALNAPRRRGAPQGLPVTGSQRTDRVLHNDAQTQNLRPVLTDGFGTVHNSAGSQFPVNQPRPPVSVAPRTRVSVPAPVSIPSPQPIVTNDVVGAGNRRRPEAPGNRRQGGGLASTPRAADSRPVLVQTPVELPTNAYAGERPGRNDSPDPRERPERPAGRRGGGLPTTSRAADGRRT